MAAPRRTSLILLGVLLVAGLALRWLYFREVADCPLVENLVLDAKNYDAWARRILEGDLLGEGVFRSNPLVPYLLAFLYKLIGPDPDRVRIVQHLMGWLSCVLLWRIARLRFGKNAAFATLALALAYGPLIFLAGEIIAESWVVFFVALSLWLIFEAEGAVDPARLAAPPPPRSDSGAVRRPSGPHAIRISMLALAGWLFGLACLGRPNLLPFSVLLVMYVMSARFDGTPPTVDGPGKERRGLAARWRLAPRPLRALVTSRALSRGGMMVLGMALAIAPVTARNLAVADELVLITSHSGVNFWIGNNESATGWFYTPPGSGLAGDQLGLLDSAHRRAERESGTELTAPQASSWWMGQALRFIARHPDEWIALTATKSAYLLNAYEKPLVGFYDVARGYSPTLRWFTIGYGLLLPLAALGIALSWRRRRTHWLLLGYIVVNLVTVTAFFVSMRYRIPILVGLLPFAGFGICEAWRRLCHDPPHRWLWWAALLAVSAVAANIPLREQRARDDAHAYYLFGTIEKNNGRYDQAADYLEKALELAPGKLTYLNNLGTMYREAGRFDEAIAAHLETIEQAPDVAIFHLKLGMAYKRVGESAKAEEAYRRALDLSPEYVKAWHNLGNLMLERGDERRALEYYQRALSIDEDFGPSRRAAARLGSSACPASDSEPTKEGAR